MAFFCPICAFWLCSFSQLHSGCTISLIPDGHYVAPRQIHHITICSASSYSAAVKGWMLADSIWINSSLSESLLLAKGGNAQSPQPGAFLSSRWMLVILEGRHIELTVNAYGFPWHTGIAKVDRKVVSFLSRRQSHQCFKRSFLQPAIYCSPPVLLGKQLHWFDPYDIYQKCRSYPASDNSSGKLALWHLDGKDNSH